MPLGVRQRVRRMDADGAGPTEIARALGISRNTVAKYASMEDLSPAPPLAPERAKPAIDPFAGWVPEVLAACPLGSAKAAPYGEADLRQARRGGGLRRVLRDGPRVRAGAGAGAAAVAWRWLPRARLGAGDHAGRLRQLRCRGRGQGPRARAARGRAPAIEVAALRGDGVREGGAPLRGARRGPRARRQGAARGGARRRDRGRSDALREGGRVAAVLADEGALPPRAEVPRPPLGKREGVRRERRRPPSREASSFPSRPSRPRPGPTRGCASAASAPTPPRATGPGSPRRGRSPSTSRRRCPSRACASTPPGGRGRGRTSGATPARAATPAAPGPPGTTGASWRASAPAASTCSRTAVAASRPRPGAGGRAHRRPPLPRAGDRRAAEGDRGAGHTPRHARRPRGGHRRRGGPRARRAPGATGRAAATSGSGAACEAARRAFDGGRVPDDASCDVLARRVAAGERDGGGAGPAACDRLVGEGARPRVA